MSVMEINHIDNLNLNLTCVNNAQASIIENELFDFARNDLIELLDKSIVSISPEEDIVFDKLTINLEEVSAKDTLTHILQILPQRIEDAIKTQLLKKQCMPIAQILQESCGSRLSSLKTTLLEKQINDRISEWCHNNSNSKFDPLRVAESILMQIRAQNPGLDIRQIACSVFEKLKNLGEKKRIVPGVRPPKAGDCGIVLLTPYIPMLLEKAGCIKAGKFIDDGRKKMALALLNYTVCGNYEPPKAEKSIAQLICGFDAGEKLAELPTISDELKALADSLLQGVIANWGALGHTSPDGLRASFLIRQGILNNGEEGPTLSVENSAYDMLLDKLPWGYSTVKLSWMKIPLQVKWR